MEQKRSLRAAKRSRFHKDAVSLFICQDFPLQELAPFISALKRKCGCRGVIGPVPQPTHDEKKLYGVVEINTITTTDTLSTAYLQFSYHFCLD